MNEDALTHRSKRRGRLHAIAAALVFAAILGAVIFGARVTRSPAERKVDAWLRGVSGGSIKMTVYEELGPEVILILVGALTNQNSRAQAWYWKVCRKMPEPVRRCLPRARNAERERSAVIIALRESRYARLAVPDLVPLMAHPSNYIRFQVASLLGTLMTKEDTAWLPNLTERLNRETDEQTRFYLGSTIRRINPNAPRDIWTRQPPRLIDTDPSLHTLGYGRFEGISEQGQQPSNSGENGKDK
jgi:hypothetical protein